MTPDQSRAVRAAQRDANLAKTLREMADLASRPSAYKAEDAREIIEEAMHTMRALHLDLKGWEADS